MFGRAFARMAGRHICRWQNHDDQADVCKQKYLELSYGREFVFFTNDGNDGVLGLFCAHCLG